MSRVRTPGRARTIRRPSPRSRSERLEPDPPRRPPRAGTAGPRLADEPRPPARRPQLAPQARGDRPRDAAVRRPRARRRTPRSGAGRSRSSPQPAADVGRAPRQPAAGHRIRYVAPADVASGLTSDELPGDGRPVRARTRRRATRSSRSTSTRRRSAVRRSSTTTPPTVPSSSTRSTTKTVPDPVDHGDGADGLEVRDPILSDDQATVSGPSRSSSRSWPRSGPGHDRAVGLDVDQRRRPGPGRHPRRGQPGRASSRRASTSTIPVFTDAERRPCRSTRSSPARRRPATRSASVTVDPPIVSVEGDADALATLTKVDTAPISIGGAAHDLTPTVALALPDGVDSLIGIDASTSRSRSRPIDRDADVLGRASSCPGARGHRTTSCRRTGPRDASAGRSRASTPSTRAASPSTADVDGLGAGIHKVEPAISLPAGVTLVGHRARPTVTVTVAARRARRPPPAEPATLAARPYDGPTLRHGRHPRRRQRRPQADPRLRPRPGDGVTAGRRRAALVVGQDTRRSGDMFVAAIAAGATSLGVDVHRSASCPTPALAFLAGTGRRSRPGSWSRPRTTRPRTTASRSSTRAG